MSERALGWIQLTDLHVGQPKEGGRVESIERALLADLDRVTSEGVFVDIVFFTGDIAFRGLDSEYVRATAILTRVLDRITRANRALAARLGIEGPVVPVLIPVPGNHDLARPTEAEARTLRDAFATRDVGAPPLWTPAQAGIRDLIDRCFAGYTAWRRHHPLPFPTTWAAGRLPGDGLATISRRGVSLGALCLNSAYLHVGDGVAGHLHLDTSQVGALTTHLRQWVEDHDFSVVLTHHPPDWLSADAQRTLAQEIRTDGNFDLHLYGHAHEGAHRTDPGSEGIRHAVEGRSLFGAEEDGFDRMHGYTVGRFVIAGGERRAEVWTRRGWSDGHGWRFGTYGARTGAWRTVIDLGASPLPEPRAELSEAPWGPRGIGPAAVAGWTRAASLPVAFPSGAVERWIFLSASVPSPADDKVRRDAEAGYVASARPDEILGFVRRFVEAAADAGFGIVIGGHPSITRVLAPIVLRRRKAGMPAWLALFQAERFVHMMIEDVGVVLGADGVAGFIVPEPEGLRQMRALMLGTPGLVASVFVGGMSGVEEEFSAAAATRRPRYAVGVGGGAAAKLLANKATATEATGELSGSGGINPPGLLWYSVETAVDAILGAIRALP